jgi:hypothetical protein
MFLEALTTGLLSDGIQERSLWLVIQKRDQNEIINSAYDSDQIDKQIAASILILYSLINVFGGFDDRFAVRAYTRSLWL